MPMRVDTIQEICLREGRDVLFAAFKPKGMLGKTRKWQQSKTRRDAIKYLNKKGINWTPCFGPEAASCLIYPYQGEIFIDVPVNPANPMYQDVCRYFEHPDGTPRFGRYWLYIFPTELL